MPPISTGRPPAPGTSSAPPPARTSRRGTWQRSDAAKNRETIRAVALAALTESSEVSLNTIANRAGVANATLYRHFPTRESLVLEVYRHEVRQLISTADQLLAEREPGDALREWVARLAQHAMTKHGLAQAIRAAASPGSALFEETYSPIVATLGKVLAAAGQAGVVRAGLDPDDVILAPAGLWEIDPATDWKARAPPCTTSYSLGSKPDPDRESHSDNPARSAPRIAFGSRSEPTRARS